MFAAAPFLSPFVFEPVAGFDRTFGISMLGPSSKKLCILVTY